MSWLDGQNYTDDLEGATSPASKGGVDGYINLGQMIQSAGIKKVVAVTAAGYAALTPVTGVLYLVEETA